MSKSSGNNFYHSAITEYIILLKVHSLTQTWWNCLLLSMLTPQQKMTDVN